MNAYVLSTTGYLQDAIDAKRAAGHRVSDEAIAHLSPAHFETINPYGTLTFDIAGALKRSRRPLHRLYGVLVEQLLATLAPLLR